MRAVLISGGLAMLIALLGTPLFIRFLVRKQYGQFIRQDGPTAHFTKRGTPTMGGVVIIGATLLGWVGGLIATGTAAERVGGPRPVPHDRPRASSGSSTTSSRSPGSAASGSSARWKIIGQGIVGHHVRGARRCSSPTTSSARPASTRISFIRDTNLDLAFWGVTVGIILFVIWANFLITAWSNAVNLTDGLDGLATGVSLIVFGAYVIVGVWQFNQSCQFLATAGPQLLRDAGPAGPRRRRRGHRRRVLRLPVVERQPRQDLHGRHRLARARRRARRPVDPARGPRSSPRSSAACSCSIVLSDVIQIGFFKMTGRRVFKMAPLHHHFELSGWGEVTIVIRFWIIAGLFVALGVGIFYAEWVAG